MMKLLFFVALVCAVWSAPISNLPGNSNPNLDMDSGYITVATGRALFYWMVRAQNGDKNAPLVFWYQGGPGCSGLGGLFTEQGPFGPALSGGGLTPRDIAWTKTANVVFLESPAGVGFSFSNDTSFQPSDTQTAKDNFAFIEGFLQQFPEFVGRDTWLTGESYAGVYVPTLAATIVENQSSQIYKQLSGFMAGNPVFRCEKLDGDSDAMDMLYYHGLVSYSNLYAWNSKCRPITPNQRPQSCANILALTLKQVGEIDQELRRRKVPQQPSLDPDSLYQDFCLGNGTLRFAETIPVNCNPIGTRVNTYLSTLAVQKAIHVAPWVLGRQWTECNMQVNAKYDANAGPINQYYEKILATAPHLKILVYSGDVDIITVPFADTKYCLAQLSNQKETKAWQPWFVNGATAGYVETFLAGSAGGSYTYATIKGAGHEAPEFQPLQAWNMFSRFLTQGNLDDLDEVETTFTRNDVPINQARALHILQARLEANKK